MAYEHLKTYDIPAPTKRHSMWDGIVQRCRESGKSVFVEGASRANAYTLSRPHLKDGEMLSTSVVEGGLLVWVRSR